MKVGGRGNGISEKMATKKRCQFFFSIGMSTKINKYSSTEVLINFFS